MDRPRPRGLPAHQAGVVLADPPGNFITYSPKGWRKSAHAHYPCMDLAEIQAIPVADFSAADSVLVLWTTQVHLLHALAVLDGWGFTFKTMGSWAKQSSTGRCWQFGTGVLLRSAAEVLPDWHMRTPATALAQFSEFDRRTGAPAQPQARRDARPDRGDMAWALRRAVRPLPARRLASVVGATRDARHAPAPSKSMTRQKEASHE